MTSPTPFRYDDRGRPIGLDWSALSANCPQDPSVWKRGQPVKDKRAGGRLSEEIETRILQLHADGAANADIAAAVDVHPMTVGAVLNRHGVTEGRGRGIRQRTPEAVVDQVIHLYTQEGLGGAGIRRETGLSHATIYKILRRNGIVTRAKRAA